MPDGQQTFSDVPSGYTVLPSAPAPPQFSDVPDGYKLLPPAGNVQNVQNPVGSLNGQGPQSPAPPQAQAPAPPAAPVPLHQPVPGSQESQNAVDVWHGMNEGRNEGWMPKNRPEQLGNNPVFRPGDQPSLQNETPPLADPSLAPQLSVGEKIKESLHALIPGLGHEWTTPQRTTAGRGGIAPVPPAAQPAAAPAGSDPFMAVSNPKGLVEPGNLPIWDRPKVQNSDGSYSSEYSTSFQDEQGREVLVPTVVGGKFLTPDGKKPPEGSQAEKEMFKAAWQHYLKTGENLGKFDNPDDADNYAEKLHSRGEATVQPPPTLYGQRLPGVPEMRPEMKTLPGGPQALVGEFKAGTPAGEAEREAYSSPMTWAEIESQDEHRRQYLVQQREAYFNSLMPRLIPDTAEVATKVALTPEEQKIYDEDKAAVAAHRKVTSPDMAEPTRPAVNMAVWNRGQAADREKAYRDQNPNRAAVEDAIQDKLSGFTRADQMLILAAVPQSRLVSLYFGGQMAFGAEQGAERAAGDIQKGDTKKAIYDATGALLDTAMATLAVRHGTHGAREAVMDKVAPITPEKVQEYRATQAQQRTADRRVPSTEPHEVVPISNEDLQNNAKAEIRGILDEAQGGKRTVPSPGSQKTIDISARFLTPEERARVHFLTENLDNPQALRDDHHARQDAAEAPKPVLHATDDVEQLRQSAERQAPAFGDKVQQATEGVPGANLEAVRDSKDTDRIEDKAERQGVKPSQIGDVLAAKVTVPDQDAAAKVAENLGQVASTNGEVTGEPGKNGVRQMQTLVPTGQPGEPVTHGEVLFQTPEMHEATAETHDDYRKAQELRAQGKEDKAAELERKIAVRHEEAEQAARQRQGEPEPKFKYGSTQHNIEPSSEAAHSLDEVRKSIPDADLAGDGRDVDGNHVTVRYGLQHAVTPELRQFIESQEPFEATLGPTEAFKPSEHSDGAAPIMAPVESPELTRINKEIEAHGQFAQSNFADYKPHATVAYVKPEAAEKYVGDERTAGKKFTVSSIAVTDRDGNKTEIPLRGGAQAARYAEIPKVVTPEGRPQPGEIRPDPNVGRMRTEDLQLDPKRFQYKMNTDSGGITNLLKGRKWNEELAGNISVWRDPADGKTYVVNGHHRYQLALENGRPDIAVKRIEAPTAEAARAIGARQNISEGRGTALDAANFFRDSGITPEKISAYGLSMREGMVSNGLALSKLDLSLFDQVVNGKLPEGRAIAIGNATADPAEQEAILKLINKAEAKGKHVTNETVNELSRMVKGAGQTTETQQSLFGVQEMTKSLALEKAEISTYIRSEIGTEKKIFGAVADEGKASKLSAIEGQSINAKRNQEIATAATQAQELYDRLSVRSGKIDDILNQAARELAHGNNPNQVKARAYAAIREALAETLRGGTGSGPRGLEAGPVPGSTEPAPARTEPKASFAAGRQSTPVEVRNDAGQWVKGTLEHYNPGFNGGKASGRVTLEDGTKMLSVRPEDMRRPGALAAEGAVRPIGPLIDGDVTRLVKQRIADGRPVKIFTRRISEDPTGANKRAVEAWVRQNFGRDLPITDVKDEHDGAIYDDSSNVEHNTGRILAQTTNPADAEKPILVDLDGTLAKSEGTTAVAQGSGVNKVTPEAPPAGPAAPQPEAERVRTFNAGRDAAKARNERQNATQARPAAISTPHGKMLALDPDSSVLWHRVFAKVKNVDGQNVLGAGIGWRGMNLGQRFVNLAAYILRERAGAIRNNEPESAAGYERLAAALDDARKPHGGATILRGDYRDDTVVEEAVHDWDRQHRMSDSAAMRELAQRPELVETADKLRAMGYGSRRGLEAETELAAEMFGKAYAGDPDIGLTPEERQEIVGRFLSAAVKQDGRAILDDLPEADATIKPIVEDLRRGLDYGEQYDQRVQGSDRQEAGPGVQQVPGRGSAADRSGEPRRVAGEPGSQRRPAGAGAQGIAEPAPPSKAELEAAGQGSLYQRSEDPGPSPEQAHALFKEKAESAGIKVSGGFIRGYDSNYMAVNEPLPNEVSADGYHVEPTIRFSDHSPAHFRPTFGNWQGGSRAEFEAWSDGLIRDIQDLKAGRENAVEARRLDKQINANQYAADYWRKNGNEQAARSIEKDVAKLREKQRAISAAADVAPAPEKETTKGAKFNIPESLMQRSRAKELRPEDSLALPGMEGTDRERANALAESQTKLLEDAMRAPLRDISGAAGRMERESPLFFGKGENPDLFSHDGAPGEDKNRLFGDSGGFAATNPDIRYQATGKDEWSPFEVPIEEYEKGLGEQPPERPAPPLEHYEAEARQRAPLPPEVRTEARARESARQVADYKQSMQERANREADQRIGEQPSAEEGRRAAIASLDDLTHSLGQRLASMPDKSATEKVKEWSGRQAELAVDRAGKFWGGIPGQFREALTWAKATSAAQVRDWQTGGLEQTGWKDAQKDRTLAANESAMKIKELGKHLEKIIPDEKTGIGAAIWAEANGDEATLRKWVEQAKVSGKHKVSEYEAALNLSPEQQGAVRDIRRDLDELGKTGERTGLIWLMRRNYVRHMMDTSSAIKAERLIDASEINPSPAFAKQRFWKNFFEAEQNGEKFKTKDLRQVVAAYHNSFNDALASRTWLRSLLLNREADGRPTFVLKSKGPWEEVSPEQLPRIVQQGERPASLEGYRIVDRPQLRHFLFKPTEEDLLPYIGDPKLFETGREVYGIRGDLMVHPDRIKAVENMLTPDWFHRGDSLLQKGARGLQTASSVVKEINTFGAPFHLATEAENSIENWVNPFKMKDIDLNSEVDRLGAQNMNLYHYDQEGLFGAKTISGLLHGFPGLSNVADLVNRQAGWMFEDYIPKLKMENFRKSFAANGRQYPDLSREQVAELTGKQVDARFGNINHALDKMPRNKTAQSVFRLLAFAPDFLEARARTVMQPFSKYGSQQRRAMARGLLMLYVAPRILNAAFNQGDAKWNWHDMFAVVIPKPKGPQGQDRGEWRLTVKSPFTEMLQLVTNPRMFASARENPLTVKPALKLLLGRDDYGRPMTAGDEAKDFFKGASPFLTQKIIESPDESLMDSVLSAFGAHMSNYRSPTEQKVHEEYLSHLPPEDSDPEKQAESRSSRQLEDDIREGRKTPTEAWKMVDRGKITPAQASRAVERAQKSRLEIEFAGVPLNKAMDIYQSASVAEKAQLHEELDRKHRAIADLPEADREATAARLDKLLGEGPG